MLQILKRVIISGFPDKKIDVPAAINAYFNIHDEPSVHDGIIFKGLRCLICHTLRPKITEKIHKSHIEVQGCPHQARETVYWPGTNSEVTTFIQKCDTCLAFQTSHSKEPLICHKTATSPWEKIVTGIFTLDDKNYLCTIDFYSGYFDVDELHSKTVKVIIKKLKKHFATNGIPNKVTTGHPSTLLSLKAS